MVDEELVRRAQKGDRDAFDMLMVSTVDRLLGIARIILRDLDLAEDATQEALVRCWRDLPKLRSVERFEAWLHRLLINAVLDESRRDRRRSAHLTVLRSQPIEPDGTSAFADRDALRQAYGRLSIDHRTSIVLHFYLGLTVEESAVTLGIPTGTAKSRLHYATESMRAALEADARRTAGERVLA